MKYWYRLIIILVLLFLPLGVFAQESCSGNDPCELKTGNERVSCYEERRDICKEQKNTLAQQITLLNSKIELTTLRINTIKSQIEKLTKEIDDLADEIVRLEQMLTQRGELVLHRIPASYKRKAVSDFGVVFLSTNVSDFIAKVKYIARVQEEDAQFLFQLKATQNNFNERKDLREKKKIQQENLKQQQEEEQRNLDRQKRQKQVLLEQTQGKESEYQRLLADAKARLASFASFADSLGISLLSNQTQCSDWGCYYNQRDSQWGNGVINGQSSGCNGSCSIARVGCLITSVAMMASHMGNRNILPSDIAFSDPNNFQVGTAYLKKTISVKGITISRNSIASSLNPDVTKDGPVIVGVYYGPFGTHFIIIKSYKDGKYIMNDPYEERGSDSSFTDHYSLDKVFEVDRVSIN